MSRSPVDYLNFLTKPPTLLHPMAVVNAMIPKVKAAGLSPERSTCWNYFLNNGAVCLAQTRPLVSERVPSFPPPSATVRRNLHVVLCFSPVGDDFRTRAKKFPALVGSTVIDWFQPWPKEALHSVGVKFLKEIDLGSDAVREGIEKCACARRRRGGCLHQAHCPPSPRPPQSCRSRSTLSTRPPRRTSRLTAATSTRRPSRTSSS